MSKTRWQAYAWNGTTYYPISVPKFKTKEKAIEEAEAIITDRTNDSVMPSIRKHYKERPILAYERLLGNEGTE